MIIEILGAPAAGKSTCTRLLKSSLKVPVILKDSKALRSLLPTTPRDFVNTYPGAWSMYGAQHYLFEPDPCPEGPDLMRHQVMEKTKERVALFMKMRFYPDRLFLWNRGISYIPIDAAMFSANYVEQDYAALQHAWPVADVVVCVTTSRNTGWQRYQTRKIHRMRKRERSRQYPGMTMENYWRRWEICRDMTQQFIQLDNERDVRMTKEWKDLVERFNDH